jgi:hypothetical protein
MVSSNANGLCPCCLVRIVAKGEKKCETCLTGDCSNSRYAHYGKSCRWCSRCHKCVDVTDPDDFDYPSRFVGVAADGRIICSCIYLSPCHSGCGGCYVCEKRPELDIITHADQSQFTAGEIQAATQQRAAQMAAKVRNC